MNRNAKEITNLKRIIPDLVSKEVEKQLKTKTTVNPEAAAALSDPFEREEEFPSLTHLIDLTSAPISPIEARPRFNSIMNYGAGTSQNTDVNRVNFGAENHRNVHESGMNSGAGNTGNPNNHGRSRTEVSIEKNVGKINKIFRKFPNRFEDQMHERKAKFGRAKTQFGLNLTVDDVKAEFPQDLSNWTMKRIFIDPANKLYRFNACRNYLAKGTGIDKEDIYIENVFCTVDDRKVIAWITADKHMIKELFKGAGTVKLERFSIFNSIPQGAKNRKKVLENLIKSYREHDPNIKYQIRTGYTDLKLMIKYVVENDFTFWREVKVEDIDAFRDVPERDLDTPDETEVTRDVMNETPPNNVFDWTEKKKKSQKKRKNMNLEQQQRKKSKNEYTMAIMAAKIRDYLNGTGRLPLE